MPREFRPPLFQDEVSTSDGPRSALECLLEVSLMLEAKQESVFVESFHF